MDWAPSIAARPRQPYWPLVYTESTFKVLAKWVKALTISTERCRLRQPSCTTPSRNSRGYPDVAPSPLAHGRALDTRDTRQPPRPTKGEGEKRAGIATATVVIEPLRCPSLDDHRRPFGQDDAEHMV